MRSRLRVALVGAGLVGQAAHAITPAEDRSRSDVVAVVDPSATVRNGVAARYGVPHATATLAEASPPVRPGPGVSSFGQVVQVFQETADFAEGERDEAAASSFGAIAAVTDR